MRQRCVWPFVMVCGVTLCTLYTGTDGGIHAQTGGFGISDYYTFELDLGNLGTVTFDECQGLGSSTEVLEQTVATNGDAGVVLPIPGTLRWHAIQLRRTGTDNGEVWGWRQAMEDGDLDKAVREGTITMFPLNATEPVARWSFQRGWAASLHLNGDVEELIIVHEGIRRIRASDDPPMTRR